MLTPELLRVDRMQCFTFQHHHLIGEKKIAEILLTFTIKTSSTIYFMKIQGHSLASFLYIFVYIYIPKWKICQFLVTSKGFKEIIDSGNSFIES